MIMKLGLSVLLLSLTAVIADGGEARKAPPLPECLAGYILYSRYASGSAVGQTVTVSGLVDPGEIKRLREPGQSGSQPDGHYWIPLVGNKVVCIAPPTPQLDNMAGKKSPFRSIFIGKFKGKITRGKIGRQLLITGAEFISSRKLAVNRSEAGNTTFSAPGNHAGPAAKANAVAAISPAEGVPYSGSLRGIDELEKNGSLLIGDRRCELHDDPEAYGAELAYLHTNDVFMGKRHDRLVVSVSGVPVNQLSTSMLKSCRITGWSCGRNTPVHTIKTLIPRRRAVHLRSRHNDNN